MHIPVMLEEVLQSLKPHRGERYIDATFGLGGYSRAILKNTDCQLLAIDRDPDVKKYSEELKKEYPEHFQFVLNDFSEIKECTSKTGFEAVDGIVLDIGVSSLQLEVSERGFSFMRDGPLDMRMSQKGQTAAEIINHMSEEELSHIFRVYGEERKAGKIAYFIVKEREKSPIESTARLADLIRRVKGKHKGHHHPATRVFQALRIVVNNELEELEKALKASEKLLKPGGRLVVITFHSLEDRIVKHFFQKRSGKISKGSRYLPETPSLNNPAFVLPKKWRVKPSEKEISQNPRSRSASLRYGYRAQIVTQKSIKNNQGINPENSRVTA